MKKSNHLFLLVFDLVMAIILLVVGIVTYSKDTELFVVIGAALGFISLIVYFVNLFLVDFSLYKDEKEKNENEEHIKK